MYSDTGMVKASEIKRVEVDALVALQIMKHARQHAPERVTGMLLGLDVQDVLQVTHCFGYVQKSSDEYDRGQDDGDHYVLEQLRRLREVNVDSNTVGWYQTTHLGQFFSDTVIETMFQFQEQAPHSILLVYDPLQSAIGKCAFKAMQLSKDFMKKYTEWRRDNSRNALNEFSSGDMFDEIPISITSPVIVEAFLLDWALQDPITTMSQLDILDVENQAIVEKNVELLSRSLQDLADEQQKIQNYERQSMRNDKGDKGKGKGRHQTQPPRQLDTMIVSKQIHNYCKQINTFAADSFGKTFLLSNKPSSSSKDS